MLLLDYKKFLDKHAEKVGGVGTIIPVIYWLFVWIGLFQAYGIAGFAIMLGAYILVKHLRKKGEIWNLQHKDLVMVALQML